MKTSHCTCGNDCLCVFKGFGKAQQTSTEAWQEQDCAPGTDRPGYKAERIQSPPKQRPTSFDIFTVENKKDEVVVEDKEQTAETKDERVVGGDVNTSDVEKAGGDVAICEYLYC